MRLGIDTGGTFTDFVLHDGTRLQVLKVLSTPAAPERAILEGLEMLGFASAASREALRIVHGSTVATNAALERQGVRTAFVTNRGFADLLTLGRQARRELYALEPSATEAPVPAELCFEAPTRSDAQGRLIEPLTDADLQDLTAAVNAAQPEAVAVTLLFSWLDAHTEERIATALQQALGDDVFICTSSFVLPEYREYERGIATWLNAWLGPRVQGYLQRLSDGAAPAQVAVMQSSGGTMDADGASRRAVNLLLSGPAGGLCGARYVGAAAAAEALLTFDMGGTSTDVALIEGEPALTSEGHIGPWPLAIPMLDIHTIGAGGGSIASRDAGGALLVGPRSAGADPGPACYGRGGTAPTVTDAHVVLGHIPASARLGGRMQLDTDAAQRAVAQLGAELGLDTQQAARGVLALAEAHMAQALRVISIERGRDPAGYTLCCFGGAGGLHVCALADALGMRQALLPPFGGVLSALGMLAARPQRQYSRTLRQDLHSTRAADVDAALRALEKLGQDELHAEGHAASTLTCTTSVDLRFKGQSSTLNVPWRGAVDTAAADFAAAHEHRYGYALRSAVELLNVRVAVSAPAPAPPLPQLAPRREGTTRGEPVQLVEHGTAMLLQRETLCAGDHISGPALVAEDTATTLILPGWQARVLDSGALLLERQQ